MIENSTFDPPQIQASDQALVNQLLLTNSLCQENLLLSPQSQTALQILPPLTGVDFQPLILNAEALLPWEEYAKLVRLMIVLQRKAPNNFIQPNVGYNLNKDLVTLACAFLAYLSSSGPNPDLVGLEGEETREDGGITQEEQQLPAPRRGNLPGQGRGSEDDPNDPFRILLAEKGLPNGEIDLMVLLFKKQIPLLSLDNMQNLRLLNGLLLYTSKPDAILHLGANTTHFLARFTLIHTGHCIVYKRLNKTLQNNLERLQIDSSKKDFVLVTSTHDACQFGQIIDEEIQFVRPRLVIRGETVFPPTYALYKTIGDLTESQEVITEVATKSSSKAKIKGKVKRKVKRKVKEVETKKQSLFGQISYWVVANILGFGISHYGKNPVSNFVHPKKEIPLTPVSSSLAGEESNDFQSGAERGFETGRRLYNRTYSEAEISARIEEGTSNNETKIVQILLSNATLTAFGVLKPFIPWFR